MINKPIIPVPRNISEGTLTIESRGNISATPGRQNVKRLHRSGGAFQTHSSDPAYDSSDMSLDSEKSFKSRLLEFYQGQGIASNGIKFDLTTSGTRGFIVFHCKLSLPPTAFLQDQVVYGTGRSKKAAEHDAAREGLKALKLHPSAGQIAETQLMTASMSQTGPLQQATSQQQSLARTADGITHEPVTQLAHPSEDDLLALCDGVNDLSIKDARSLLKQVYLRNMELQKQLSDLQNQVSEIQALREQDRGKIKFAAQVLLAQGIGYKAFKQSEEF